LGRGVFRVYSSRESVDAGTVQQDSGGLDCERDRRLQTVAGLGQQLQQLGKPGRVVTDGRLDAVSLLLAA